MPRTRKRRTTRTQRRAVHVAAQRLRNERDRLYAQQRPARTPLPVTVTEPQLTREQRGQLRAVLGEIWTDRATGEIPYDSAVTVALTANILTVATRLTLEGGYGGQKAAELSAVLERHGLVLLTPDTCKEWGDWEHTYAVRCARCGTASYGKPTGTLFLRSDIEWPSSCWSCEKPLPRQHSTEILPLKSNDEAAKVHRVECSCGWETRALMNQASARGQETRHIGQINRIGVEHGRPPRAW